MTLGFEVERIDDVALDGPEELLAKNLMSPFVWRVEGDAGLLILVRAVPPDKGDDEESGRIWYGRSGSDGLTFRMDADPMMVPTSGAHDSMGCEDPTVVRTDDGYVVFYTGVDAEQTGHLLYATGPDMRSLEKRGIALPNSKSEQNSKEATLLRADDHWHLLYEYSHHGHSLISLTDGDGPDGPWHERPDPFGPRPGKWDGWHLSTGPLLRSDPERPVMFYNGATEDAAWGIGWAALSPDLRTVVARGDDPLIAPPPDPPGPRDISFAASVVDTEGTIWLYYSRNDRELKRATIRQDRVSLTGRAAPIVRRARPFASLAALPLGGCAALKLGVVNHAGPIAASQWHLYLIVGAVLVFVAGPVLLLVPIVAWHYRLANKDSAFRPQWIFSWPLEGLIWIPPAGIVIGLAFVMWHYTHRLDPYRPIASLQAPLEVEAVALDWKWLFLYPDQHIATVNELDVPVGRPLNLRLTSGTVMQSLLIPQLAGQIYAMAGMTSQMNLEADRAGTFRGENTQFDGQGFQAEKFNVVARPPAAFATWLGRVRASNHPLDTAAMATIFRRSVLPRPAAFSAAPPDLFRRVLARSQEPGR